jgi:competence protein ComEC
LTHPEKDHMAGILDVLKKYKVDYFLWTGVVRQTPEFDKLAEILKQKEKMQIITARAGEKIKAGGVLIDILHPFENLAGKELKNTNDTSIVSKLIFGENSFLFTGDISSAAEKRLSYSREYENLESDALKVAHHGSKYSTSELFLENTKPKIAVISNGKDNSYGHPTPEVLQRLKKYDIKTLRTDQSGDIELASDGKNIYPK